MIIYENNSQDNTAKFLTKWAKKNSHVSFISEKISHKQLPKTREERIAIARNIVLSLAKKSQYDDFKYLIMVDLDFLTPWPITEIVNTIKRPGEWDCISANGVFNNGTLFWDRYAYRDEVECFGPELLGSYFWDTLFVEKKWFGITGTKYKPVYSAFGGLAIYKRSVIVSFTYSGTVTSDLQQYYEQIVNSTPETNIALQKYLAINQLNVETYFPKDNHSIRPIIPVIWQTAITCEHLPLHATMALKGYDKFYVNPKLYMYYSH